MVTAATLLTLITLAVLGKFNLVTDRLRPLKGELVPLGVLLACMAFLFLIRLPLGFQYDVFADDIASYLYTRNWVLGTDLVGMKEAHFRPPLIGITLVPFTALFGDLWGSKLVALITSVALAVPVYALARYWLRPWPSIVVGVAVILTPSVAEYTFGGYLPLIALGMALFALRALLDIKDKRAPIWLPCLATLVMGGLNQSITPIFALVGFILVLPSRKGILALALATFAAILPWSWFLFYNIPFGPPMIWPGIPILGFRVHVMHLMYLPVAMVLFAFLRDWRLLAIIGVLMLTSSMYAADIAINNVLYRSGYMLPLFIVIGLAVLATKTLKKRQLQIAGFRNKAIVALGICALLYLGNLSWEYWFHAPADRLHLLTESDQRVVHWIGENTPEDAHIWAHPRGLAYWVGAWSPRYWTGSWHKALVGREAQERAIRCTLGMIRECPDRYEADYYAVDTSWPGYWTRDAPWLTPVFQDGTTTVYRYDS